jgi:hypothetical protein
VLREQEKKRAIAGSLRASAIALRQNRLNGLPLYGEPQKGVKLWQQNPSDQRENQADILTAYPWNQLAIINVPKRLSRAASQSSRSFEPSRAGT